MTDRKFKCNDCGHTVEVPHGTGKCGSDMGCPSCHGRDMHREGHRDQCGSGKHEGQHGHCGSGGKQEGCGCGHHK